MRVLFVLFILLLAACTNIKDGYWDKPGYSDQQFQVDRGDCIAKAFVAPTATQQSAIVIGCFQSKGYYWREQ